MRKKMKKVTKKRIGQCPLQRAKGCSFGLALAFPQVDAIYCKKLEWFEWSICSCCLRTKLDQWWGDVTTFTSLDLFHLSMREASSPTPPRLLIHKNTASRLQCIYQNSPISPKLPNRSKSKGHQRVITSWDPIGILRYTEIQVIWLSKFCECACTKQSTECVYSLVAWQLGDDLDVSQNFPGRKMAPGHTSFAVLASCTGDGDSLPGNRRPERPAKWMLTDNRTTRRNGLNCCFNTKTARLLQWV